MCATNVFIRDDLIQHMESIELRRQNAALHYLSLALQ